MLLKSTEERERERERERDKERESVCGEGDWRVPNDGLKTKKLTNHGYLTNYQRLPFSISFPSFFPPYPS